MPRDFKVQLKAAYDADAQRRIHIEGARPEWKITASKNFADLATAEHKQTILEVGAGIGSDSVYFRRRGFDVLATDLSGKMVEVCKEKGLNAQVLDLYDLQSLGRRFDAIYSLNVLLHVPKKDLDKVLTIINDTLNPRGIFFYGVYGGIKKEEVYTDSGKMNMPRFFSFFDDETLRTIASKRFEIINSETIDVGESQGGLHFQSLLLRKR